MQVLGIASIAEMDVIKATLSPTASDASAIYMRGTHPACQRDVMCLGAAWCVFLFLFGALLFVLLSFFLLWLFVCFFLTLSTHSVWIPHASAAYRLTREQQA